MGHLSLNRKYRSQTFADVVGQEHVTRTLGNALTEQRMAHAYLFSGPRGTGKTSTARILAKALNCERAPTAEPCNACPSCLEITEGTSIDVVEIDAASHGSVDDARDLREKVAYAPVSGRWKVYIVDECHMLSPAANNALLKVLEEPPSHVVFVFATTEPHKVLQTLLDRCQRYEFRAVTTEAIAARVLHVCEAEGIEIEEEAAGMIASRAAGSVRDALSLLEQLASYAGRSVGAEDFVRLLGSLPEEVLFEAVDLVSERDAGGCFAFTDRLIRSGRDIREFVRALQEHLRALFLVLHAPAAHEVLDVSDEKLERLRAQANRLGGAELLRLIDLTGDIHLALRQPVDGRLVLEVGLVRMARPDLHASPASLLARLERLERAAGAGPVAASAPDLAAEAPPAEPPRPRSRATAAPPRPAEAPPDRTRTRPAPEPRTPAPEPAPAAAAVDPGSVDLEHVVLAWGMLLEKVKRRKISAQAMLTQATPVAFADGELVLEFGPRHGFHRDRMANPAYQSALIEAFHDTFRLRPRVRCVLGTQERHGAPVRDEPATMEPVGEAPPQQPAGRPASPRDPVDMIREGFGAEIVEEF